MCCEAVGQLEKVNNTSLKKHRSYPQQPSIVRPGIDEVVAPDMIGSLRTKPDTGTVIEPQPSSRPLFLRNFQPLTPPDPLHSVPACLPS